MIQFIKDFFEALFARPHYDIPIDDNTMNTPIKPPKQPQDASNIDTLIPDWSIHSNARHNVRVIADLEGLTLKQKNELSQTIHCESNYNPNCIHPNIVNGKTTSTDYGICQVNDFYHIGPGKDFPSVEYVLANPEACVRWMCKQFLAGNARLWVCYSKSLYLNYPA